MRVGRQNVADRALMVLGLDDQLPETLLAQIARIPDIFSVRTAKVLTPIAAERNSWHRIVSRRGRPERGLLRHCYAPGNLRHLSLRILKWRPTSAAAQAYPRRAGTSEKELRVRKFLAAFTVATVLIGLAGMAGRGVYTASAAQTTLEGVAVGAQENPVVSTVRAPCACASSSMTLPRRSRTRRTVNGLSQDQVTAAHFHRAASGTNGPIIINLSLVPFTHLGTVQLSDADVADLRAGLLYFNAHSKDNPWWICALPAPPGGRPSADCRSRWTLVTAPSAGDAGLLGLSRDHSDAWQPFAALIVSAWQGRAPWYWRASERSSG